MKEFLTFLLVLLSLGYISSNPSCAPTQPGMINVHLVCHTHDDVGWLKTVDQYYYGSRKSITWVGVQYILDSVVTSLLRDPTRKFIYVESAFFYRWWNEQDDVKKNQVKGLVDSGQLEFISGGWSMNDEAATHYNDLIDQMTLGLIQLNETFGPVAFPRVAWQIDPFGHSIEQASLFAQMGMDGLFFSRLDYDDKSNRWSNKEMEMVWQASNSLGSESWLFTGVLPNHYSPPSGFCFDILCGDDPIMDDPNLEDYNKDDMVDRFLSAVSDQANGYLTSNLIMTMGEDFHYVNAEVWYINLDKLIKYVNERQVNGSNVNVMYSTPSCYVDALHSENIAWPTKGDDFFPYASDTHSFWTGYFTSRPTLKGFIRQSNNILQVTKQIAALTGIERGPAITTLAQALGVAQHHDAVTGTAKQHVTDDYSMRLARGVDAAGEILTSGFRAMTMQEEEESESRAGPFTYCPLLNISSCSFTENTNSFVVNVYNPIGRPRSHYVRIPVTTASTYTVQDSLGNLLTTQIVGLPRQVLDMPGRVSTAQYELIFYAEDLPPLGTDQFLVQTSGILLEDKLNLIHKHMRDNEDLVIEKGIMRLTFDAQTKKLKSIGPNTEVGLQDMNVTQNWMWYSGYPGSNDGENDRASGAYIFRPEGEASDVSATVNMTAEYDGLLVNEIHQEWTPWVTHIIRSYSNKSYVEIEWLVGPIPTQDNIGKEIINRFQWDNMATNQTFYTDANGREMQKRVKDYRETWTLSSTEPISQNYYPVTSRIILSSTNGQGNAAILNDRAQGGTSLSEGQMELMVHRRLLHDDGKGVGESLTENAYGEGLVARGRHFLIHSDFDTTECDFGCQHRTLGEELLLQPILTFSPPATFKSREVGTEKKAGLISALPSNLRLLTLEPWTTAGKWLLRLENFYEAGESSLSGSVDFDLRDIFTDWTILDVQEVTLGANAFKDDIVRLEWNTAASDTNKESKLSSDYSGREVPQPFYSFSPMQIRSFIVEVVHK